MVKKEFKYRGKAVEEIKAMSIKDFMMILPARERRSLKRGFTEEQKQLISKIEKKDKKLRTHCRDMVIIPMMIGLTIEVYQGKEFIPVLVNEEMMGHRLGEFTQTRRRVTHGAPGIGATKSSGSVSVK